MTEVKLSKWGNSYGIRISKQILEQLEIINDVEKAKFDLEIKGKKIIMELTTNNTLLKLFENFDGNSEDYIVDVDWGSPVGNEEW